MIWLPHWKAINGSTELANTTWELQQSVSLEIQATRAASSSKINKPSRLPTETVLTSITSTLSIYAEMEPALFSGVPPEI
jgi:hypothetical protein